MGTEYKFPLAGEPDHYTIHDGWLLYTGCLCITTTHRAALLHDAHDSLIGDHHGINGTLTKLDRAVFLLAPHEEGCK